MYTMFPRLKERQHTAAGVLSGGEQQMLTLCRTLMGDPDLIMIDEPTEGLAPKIVELVKAEFPLAKLLVRAFDRGHSLRLIEAGVDFQIRETFESALTFGKRTLIELGVDEVEAAEIVRDVRRRDTERLELQVAGGLQAGRWLMRGNMATPTPEPFSVPRHGGKALNTEAADVLAKSPKQLAE